MSYRKMSIGMVFNSLTTGVSRRILATLLSSALVFPAGCAGIGPRTVQEDRVDYINAISESWKEQMLLNIVKIRYGDVPIFLDVASVISQYSIETSLDARFGWAQQNSQGTNNQSVGGSAKYTDRPTVTYSPLAGEKFARSLMTPVRPVVVMSLIQAGYPVDLVLRFCAHSINGLRNDYGGPARERAADKDFYPLLAALKRIQNAGALGFRVLRGADGSDVIINFPLKVDPQVLSDIQFVLDKLQLEPNVREYNLGYGLVPSGRKEIAMLTRSIFDILIDVASHIEVPAEHVQEQRVNNTIPAASDVDSALHHLVRVQSSKQRPKDTMVMTRYRDYWFWIDDRDQVSKRLFSFLMFILALTETGDRATAPLVTIPTG